MKQKIFNDKNINQLISLVGGLDFAKILIVSGGDSYKKSGAKYFIDKHLKLENAVVFSDFNINPQIEDLRKGISVYEEGKYDLIIAIGGGSVVDMAKLISVFAHQENDIESYLKADKIIDNIKTPLLAIPTTSGTGAETTAFAVLYNHKTKYSVASKTILPDYVFLSPKFSQTANPYLTACTGLDALCQAIESVWSVSSISESEEYAYRAIDIIWENLANAVNNNDIKAKTMMQEAAFLSGKAINITKTTAPHALSYAFTSYYNIPHGHAVALSLPYFIDFNYNILDSNCLDNRGSKSVKLRIDKILDILGTNPDMVTNSLVSFFKEININIDIPSLIKDFNTDIIVNNVNTERLKNNPRKIDTDDIINFLIKSKTY